VHADKVVSRSALLTYLPCSRFTLTLGGDFSVQLETTARWWRRARFFVSSQTHDFALKNPPCQNVYHHRRLCFPIPIQAAECTSMEEGISLFLSARARMKHTKISTRVITREINWPPSTQSISFWIKSVSFLFILMERDDIEIISPL
jgi:hypothetical protein